MDSQAYLLRLGWSGPGNPLNPNKRPGLHGGLGLTKPILAARKHNTHGLGRTTTADPKNMWWLRGFEDVLKGVGDDGAGEERRGEGVARTGLTGELYRFFVRGQGLKGTIGESEVEDKKEATKKGKRKREDENSEDGDKPKKMRKEVKRRKKLERAEKDSDEATSPKESKEQRRRRKQEKREKRERKEMKRAKKAKLEKREPDAEDYPTPAATEPEQDSSQDGSVDIKASKRREKKQKEGKKDKKEKKSKDKNLKKKSISENPAKSKSKKEEKDKMS